MAKFLHVSRYSDNTPFLVNIDDIAKVVSERMGPSPDFIDGRKTRHPAELVFRDGTVLRVNETFDAIKSCSQESKA